MVPDDSMNNPLCHSAIGSMVTFDYSTPDTGYEPKDMELTDTNELNIAASSDIYFQDSLEDTVSFSNPDIDDDELGKLLAIVVDRTGQPVLERSNSDHFSCSVRNVVKLGGLFKKGSLRSVKALMHRLGLCWMNSEERLSLNTVKKFFITNPLQLKQNKIAEFYKMNYCDNNRIFVKFINKIL